MVSNNWRSIKLEEVLVQDRDYVNNLGSREYPKLSVKLYGKGCVVGDSVRGDEVKMQRHQIAMAGQIILSEIWGKKGAIGIVPPNGNGALVTSHFFLFDLVNDEVEPAWLHWLINGNFFEPGLSDVARGSTGYAAVRPKQFLELTIPLPPPDEQRRIVAKLDALRMRVEQALKLQGEAEDDLRGLLLTVYTRITEDRPRRSMAEVAPLVRRTVDIEPNALYPELGLRSYGKGTFHKPAIQGSDLGAKRIFRIEAGDVVFSNVFSWEGAVAVAGPDDHGRFGSHRFISRIPIIGIITPQFLFFHFTTEDGLMQLREASPGSAGRNRTLGLGALDTIEVPVPEYKHQLWFGELFAKVKALRFQQIGVGQELEAILPAALDLAFRGDL